MSSIESRADKSILEPPTTRRINGVAGASLCDVVSHGDIWRGFGEALTPEILGKLPRLRERRPYKIQIPKFPEIPIK